jgi:ABC-type dipeptide/oligopeptide/nickel transport system permease component
MFRRIISRLLILLPVTWLVVTLVFMMLHIVPGDPIEQMLGEGAASADIAAARKAYGLDVPLQQQYVNYWKGVARGDLGKSIRLQQPVTSLIADAYPSTLLLTFAALIVALMIAIPAGVTAARHHNQWQDRTLGLVSLLGLSFPSFALGPILILIFAIWLGWLPVSGTALWKSPSTWVHLILPAITLGGSLAAILTRMVRTALLEELSQDYIRTARAKGLPERAVIYRHALRNAMIPVLTIVGMQFGSLLAGTVIAETIFTWRGIGRLTYTAIGNRDYFLVQGCILCIGLTYIVVNFLTDLMYSVVDPRVRS